MQLAISDTLRKYRNALGITQEQLAEALGVSCQSVSRWELDVCYPDIELLPAISNYFDITLDELLGMNDIRNEARKRAIFTEVFCLERQGNWRSAADALRQAMHLYPKDDGLSAELVLVLTQTGDARDRLEAIELSEMLLGHPGNEKLRSTVMANLCFLYMSNQQSEKAISLAKTLPHIWECREVLLPFLYGESEQAEALERLTSIAKQVLRDTKNGKPIPFSLGYQAK